MFRSDAGAGSSGTWCMARGVSTALAERRLPSTLLVGTRAHDAPVALVYPHVVDACFAPTHQTVLVELPQLVAVAAPPLATAIVAFVLETHCDAVVVVAPQVLA